MSVISTLRACGFFMANAVPNMPSEFRPMLSFFTSFWIPRFHRSYSCKILVPWAITPTSSATLISPVSVWTVPAVPCSFSIYFSHWWKCLYICHELYHPCPHLYIIWPFVFSFETCSKNSIVWQLQWLFHLVNCFLLIFLVEYLVNWNCLGSTRKVYIVAISSTPPIQGFAYSQMISLNFFSKVILAR